MGSVSRDQIVKTKVKDLVEGDTVIHESTGMKGKVVARTEYDITWENGMTIAMKNYKPNLIVPVKQPSGG